MCYADQCSRWPYAPSWIPNRQRTRNTNRCYHLLTCAAVQSLSAPAFSSSFSVLETSSTTIWLVFQLKHLPCTSMFWFKREGRSSTAAAHVPASDSVGDGFHASSVHRSDWPVRQTRFAVSSHERENTLKVCPNPSLLREPQSASSSR